MSSKFSDEVSEALWILVLDGWADLEGGSVEFGLQFNQISIGKINLKDLQKNMVVTRVLEDVGQLIGHWVVTEDNYGFVTSIRFDSEQSAIDCFDRFDRMGELWEEGVTV